jgi:hypothetical protein
MNTQKRIQPVRRLQLVCAVALILGLLCIAAPSAARDVPFPTEHTVDAAFTGADDVRAADIDGDGNLDVIGAAYNAGDISWWENTAGDGSAWTEHSVDTDFATVTTVHAADLDGDGDIDILGVGYGTGIHWCENTAGDGTAWTKHTVDGEVSGASSGYAADVDGDGDLDVLGTAANSDDVAWWENTAGDASSWTKHDVDTEFDGAYDVHAADVDGDGDLDVLGAADTDDDIVWWENTAGDGSSWTEHAVDTDFDGAISVYTADIDGDGHLDVLGAARDADDIAWWENTAGDGSSWTEHTVDAEFDGAYDVYADDVDGDGDLDVLGAAFDADDIAWWENTAGDGSSWTEHTVDAAFDAAASVYAADVDGDGDPDVLGAARNAHDIAWWENETIHRSAHYPAPGDVTVDAYFDGANSVYGADVDGDGDLDVLGAAYYADDITWWENAAGDGSAWTEHTVDGAFDGAASVYAVDVDGDGDMDVLGAAAIADDIAWWENTAGDGSGWSEHSVDTDFDGPYDVYAADVDGDGDVDVLSAAWYTDDIAWWENTAGDGSAWSEHSVDTDFDAAFHIHAADVDGDGDLDVVGAAYKGNDIAWWENTLGDGSAWSEHTVDAEFNGACSVYAADVDKDGDMDILGAAFDADDIAWWENTAGDGTSWTEHTVDDAFDGAASVYAADVDEDGDLDILGAGANADDIAWWENTLGDGSDWTEHTVDADFDGAVSVYAADVDGDGDPDMLGAADIAHEVAWWENRGGQFALATSDTAPGKVNTGAMDDILEIEVIHRGRSGDTDLELVTLELLFQGCYGSGCTPANLTTAQANELFDELRIYKDTGSTLFESGADTLVTTVTPLALTAGVQTITFGDGDPNVQIAHATPQTYFVVVDRVDSAPGTPTVDRFTITHITEASSSAEDRSHDIGLTLEYAADAASSQVVLNQAPIADGGSDQSVGTGAILTLDGSGSSDPDGDLPLAYYWTQTGGTGVSFTPGLSVTTFTAPSDPAVLTFTLAVTDSLGLPDLTPDEVVITVDFHHAYLPLLLREH